MKTLLKILFIIFIIWMIVGTYLIQTEHPKGQIVMGLGVFYLSFLLMPVFIYYRYRDGKYKKYQLNDQKIKEMIKDKEV
jgi:quinol-cytochrome oxidoreductase complex cytochrome b subunit